MRLVLAQINPIVGDWSGNLQKVLDSIASAKEKDIPLIVFPELALVGYPPEDFLLFPHFIYEAKQALQQVIGASEGIAVILGTVRDEEGKEKNLYNTAAVIEDGHLLGFQDKILLPTYDVFDERRYFSPGEEVKVWQLAGRRFGITICEDIWQHSGHVLQTSYKRDPVKELEGKGLDGLINLSASPYHFQKLQTRIDLTKKASKTLQVPVYLCNQVGANDSLIFAGYSMVVDGKNVQLAQGFKEQLFEVNDEIISTPLPGPMEDLYSALVLGISDYFHKQGFTKACLGLSGGVDSALVACLAVEALGKENVLALRMPSRYSSEGSLTDAKELIDALNIPSKDLSIEPLFQGYLDALSPHFEGKKEDATEENLQARIRGMLLMAFSNKFGHILLSTGNKSELALGYSTLYGDLCGGLAVISDLTKKQVYALCQWINTHKGAPIPETVLSKPPSAELRPDQKDSDTLPDYAVIDHVLEAYVEWHLSADEIVKKYGYNLELVQGLIKKIHQNEYKRRQMAIGLRVTEKSFSIGRRFPVVQKFV